MVDVRTGAKHADGRLGLWNRHGFEEDKAAHAPLFINIKTDNKLSIKYISPSNIFVRANTSFIATTKVPKYHWWEGF